MTNPYQPPTADADEAAPQSDLGDYVLASTGQRFVNFLIDYIAFVVLSALVGAALALLGMAELLEGFNGNIFGILMMLTYYLAFEGVFGRTPGKLVTGTKVIDMNGGPPRWTQILGRTFTRFVPFEPLSFFGSGGWHDRWSGTVVVRVRR